MALIQKTFRSATRKSSDRYMSNELSWCVTCAPGPKWAENLLGEGKSEDDLAEVLAKVLMIDRDDYLTAWNEFDTEVKARREKLNSLKIKTLHYQSSVTDFTISLRDNASFGGGASATPDGKSFFPNLPTEELFTTPDMYTAEGYITTTRPVSVTSPPKMAKNFCHSPRWVMPSNAPKITSMEISGRMASTDSVVPRLSESMASVM